MLPCTKMWYGTYCLLKGAEEGSCYRVLSCYCASKSVGRVFTVKERSQALLTVLLQRKTGGDDRCRYRCYGRRGNHLWFPLSTLYHIHGLPVKKSIAKSGWKHIRALVPASPVRQPLYPARSPRYHATRSCAEMCSIADYSCPIYPDIANAR